MRNCTHTCSVRGFNVLSVNLTSGAHCCLHTWLPTPAAVEGGTFGFMLVRILVRKASTVEAFCCAPAELMTSSIATARGRPPILLRVRRTKPGGCSGWS